MTHDAAAPSLDLAVVDRLLTTTKAVRRRLDLTRPVEQAIAVGGGELNKGSDGNPQPHFQPL
jgi:hypothetical protein